MAQQRMHISWSSVLVALLGAAYCAFQVSPLQESFPCPSSGCFLYSNAAVAGISAWWFGGAAFVLVAALCLWRMDGIAYLFVLLCLAVDTFLLVLMIFTAPCVSCLGAAFFFGVLFLLLRRPGPSRYGTAPTTRRSVLFFVWLMLFIANSLVFINEFMGEWVIAGPAQSERRVYFSPSCPACREAVSVFAGRAAFVPVAEKDGDFEAILRIQAALASGMALEKAVTGSLSGDVPQVSMASAMKIQLQLLRNKAKVLRLGFTKLPLLMINGMPQVASGAASGAAARGQYTPAAGRGAGGSSELPVELQGSLGQCEEGPAPCEEPVR